MKERKFKALNLKVREWKMFEVRDLQEDDGEDVNDYDLSADYHFARKKKAKPEEAVDYDRMVENTLTFCVLLYTSIKCGWLACWRFNKRFNTYKELCRAPRGLRDPFFADCGGRAPREDVRSMISTFGLGPELDTVRVYFDCSSFLDIDSYIGENSTKRVYSVSRDPLGNIDFEKEFYRNEMRCSWWGKMTISKEVKKFGHNGINKVNVLSFEYSVAKWWHYASAVNSGEEPSAELLLLPCIQAMKAQRIEEYAIEDISFNRIAELFIERAEIRRFDLSLNFKVPPQYTPTDYVKLISRCMINRQFAHPHDDGSISFATEKSPYRVIVYDKEKEAEKYYNDKKGCKRYYYYQDEDGRCYDWCPGDGIKTTCVNVDEFAMKRDFYEKNKDKFRGNLRFEVQFRTKFMQEHNMSTTGKENIDNVIRLGKFYWVELLDQIDQQLGRTNFEYKEDQKEPVAEALMKLEERRDAGVYSRTKANNMIMFLKDCYSKSWKKVHEEMGRDLFSRYRKWILNELNYDVKVAQSEGLPIMRIMQSLCVSRDGQMVKGFQMVPAPVERLAI